MPNYTLLLVRGGLQKAGGVMPRQMESYVIDIGHRKVRYLRGGHGKPLVILHGGANGADTWRKNAAELSGRHTVYVPDLPGFGDSDSLGGEFNYAAFVAFVNDFVGALGLNNFNLVGHSLGGCIALLYALQHPDHVAKLVLVSSLGIGKSIGRRIKYLSTPVFMYLVGAPLLALFYVVKWIARKISRPVRLLNNPVTRMNVNLGRKISTLAGQTLVLTDRLCELVVPTLVVWGEGDGVVPVRHAYVAANLIPDCRLQVFDGGHSIHRQRMAEFSEALNDFLGDGSARTCRYISESVDGEGATGNEK